MNTNAEIKTGYQEVLFNLMKKDNSDFNLYVTQVIKAVSITLNVERVSLWLYSEDRDNIKCNNLYINSFDKYENGQVLFVKDYPNYFRSLSLEKGIRVKNAQHDVSTNELYDNYIKKLGITSMMDIPVWHRGEIIGIVCHEDVKIIRSWSEEEFLFAITVAELIAIAYERSASMRKEKDLLESQRFLNTLVSNLPGYVYRCQDEDGVWITNFSSEGIYELTGYEPYNFLKGGGMSFSNLLLADEQPKLAQAVKQAIDVRKPYQINYRIRTKNGEIKWVWEQGRGIFDENGHLTATEGFITDITAKKIVEEEIIKRNEELSTLNQISKSLSKFGEEEQILETIFKMIGKLYHTDNLYIALHDQSANRIRFPVYFIEGERKTSKDRELQNGITEHVLHSKRPLLIKNDVVKMLMLLGIDRLGKEANSLISVPMLAGEKAFGVITLQDYKNENVFKEQDADLLMNIASQAAIAIENARLYSAIQNELEEKKRVESSLKKSLKEKEVLLQEVHHRVKNNLQIMSSLLRLQAKNIQDEDIVNMFKESESRVRSMAIVHNKLYHSGNYERIDFADYLKSLSDNLIQTFSEITSRIKFNFELEKVMLNIDTAIPCGLLVNELLSNAAKYAFPDKMDGEISIILKNEKDGYFVSVKDNGIGIPIDIADTKPDSLGLKLVHLLTDQINGKLEILKNSGTEFRIYFKELQYKPRT